MLRGKRPSLFLPLALGAVLVVAASCADDLSAPRDPVPGYFALAPQFVAAQAGIVPISRIRVVVRRSDDGSIARDTVVQLTAGQDSVDLQIGVSVLRPEEPFTVRLSLITAAGDTAFRAGPIPVVPATSGATLPVATAAFVYVGVGANAASVEIVTVPAVPVATGDTARVVAVARDSAGAIIPGTPIGWRTLDPGIVTVARPDSGIVVGGGTRGTGRVVAQLLTGPADTAGVAVTLPPANLTAVSGSGQTGPVSGLLPTPLVARVTASDGIGVAGVTVNFTAATGGGTFSAASVVTDSAGNASTGWTLGPNVGAQTAQARTPTIPGAVATFTATGTSAGAGTVMVSAGDGQAALVGTAVPVAPAVIVRDLAGNPVAGTTVTFAVSGGGGGVTGGTQTTNASGIATVGSWTLGPNVGVNNLTATVAGLSPVVFTATATGPNGAFTMAVSAGDNQSATVGATVPVAPAVLVTDTAGNPAANVPVTFAVTAGGGSVTGGSATTNASGIAAVGSWSLGPAAGANTLSATVTGLPAVTFTATGLVGPPDTVVVISGNGQSDTAGTALPQPLVVEVRDSLGNAVPGATVNWSTLQGSLSPASGATDGAGRAQSTWTLGTNAVNQTATAAVTGLTPAVFSATAIFPNPSILLDLASGGNRIVSGGSATLNVTLTAPAPAGGVTVAVTSDNPAIISVQAPGTVFIAQGGTTGQITLNAPGGGTTIVRGMAPGYLDGALSLIASVQVLSMPPTLNVPLAGTASVPLQISTPAPAGGVTVTLSSDNPAAVSVQTPSVTIPQGSQTANAIVNGVAPGSATITGTTANFGSAQSLITTTANLNITTSSVTINGSFGATVRVRLESSGTPIAAPTGGITVTMTSSDPTCIAATSPVTIPAGLVDTLVDVTYGGTATLSCSGTVAASAPNIQPDTLNVTVNPVPAISVTTATSTGSGLQRFASGGLGASNHPGVNVVVRSTNPAVALVAPNTTTPGTDSIVIPLVTGSTGFSYYAQGVVGQTGAADFVVTAPGFIPDTTAVTVLQPAVDIIFLNTSTTSFTPADPFQLRIGIPDAGNNFMSVELARSPGLPTLTGTLVLTDSAVAELETTADTGGTATVDIVAGQARSPGNVASGGVQLAPRTAGSTTVSATIPGYVVLPTASVTVNITAPGMSVTTATTTGSGLQRFANGGLGASNHPGVNVVVRSTNPAVALVAPDQTTPGTDSIIIPLATGFTGFSYYAQGVDGQTGTADFVVTAQGFTPDTTAVTVVQPAVDIIFLNTSTTSFTPPDAFQLRIGIPDAGNNFMSVELARSPGLPALTGTIVLSDSTVAELETSVDTGGTAMVQITPPNARSPGSVAAGGVQLAPRTAGSTTASATIPGYVVLPTASVTVNITAPGMSVTTATTTGSGLQRFASGGLLASNHPGVNVVVRSTNPAVALVAPDAATPGTDSIIIPLATGFTGFSYYAQGVVGQVGAADFVVTAQGFIPDTTAVTVVQPAVDLIFLGTSITTLDPHDAFQARIGIPNAGNTFMSVELARSAGLPPVTATVVSSNPGVGQLVTQAFTGSSVTTDIVAQGSRSPSSVGTGGVEFEPLTAGSTTVSLSIPGFVTLPTASQTVTVTTPVINLSSTTTGSGLQRFVSGSLGASQHGGVQVIVKSSNFGVLKLSPAADSAGRDSLIFNLANGFTGFSYYVQGQDAQTGTVSVTARASGFTDGSSSIDVVAPAVDIIFLNSPQTAGGADDPYQARIGIPNAQQTFMSVELTRNGGAAPLSVDMSSGTPAVGTLVFQSGVAASGTVLIQPAQARSPSTVASNGVAFRPLTAGTSVVSAMISGFITLPAGMPTVVVNP